MATRYRNKAIFNDDSGFLVMFIFQLHNDLTIQFADAAKRMCRDFGANEAIR